ncbi:MAG: hypothetical protein JXR64_02795 [Spirochaetales bacterium]|nr:hypothetical protein [Spirochaetales bacterium]
MTNLVGLWCNLFRAIEIAKIGGYSISVYFDGEYKNGFDDYLSIKTFCKGWFNDFVSDGDIKIEIIKPRSYEINGKWETLECISNRIEKSLQFQTPELKLHDYSEVLLKTATQKLDLSLSQVEKIKQIAITIAQMDFSKTVQAQHVAESIQYSFIHNDTRYNAESKSKMFGDMIQIKLGKIDKRPIKSAINYLNTLLYSKT